MKRTRQITTMTTKLLKTPTAKLKLLTIRDMHNRQLKNPSSMITIHTVLQTTNSRKMTTKSIISREVSMIQPLLTNKLRHLDLLKRSKKWC